MIITKGTLFTDEVSEYEVIRQIGKGGFGAVWLVLRKNDNCKYALKTLLSDFQDEEELKVLTNEMKMAMQVSSPNVIKYVYTHDGGKFLELPPYIIMEYAESGSLSDLLESKKQSKQLFSNDDLVKFFLQLVNGMTAVNSRLVHRDIKPENILIHQNLLKITDFGLCKLACEQTRTKSFKGYGTPRYISPEAWIPSNKNTIQMDIYSMGIVFYELATLSYPYDISNEREYLHACQDAHTFGVPKTISMFNKDINPALSSIIMKMLEKTTSKRYKDWSEILTAVSNLSKPSSSDSRIIDNMLNIQMARDSAKKAEEFKKQKRMEEIEAFNKKVSYQYQNDVITPLTALVEEFNMKSQNERISLSRAKSGNITKIRMPSGTNITIHIQSIIEENFVRQRRVNDWGQVVRDDYYGEFPGDVGIIERVEVPLYKGERILAWGGLYSDSGQGYNLFLVEQKNELYGKWLFIVNTNSGLSREPRTPEPFAFRFEELEKAVQRMSVVSMSKFNSQEFEFSESMLFTFIMNNL